MNYSPRLEKVAEFPINEFASIVGYYSFESATSEVFSLVEEGEEVRESVGLTRHWVDKAEFAMSVNNLEEIKITSPRCRCDWPTDVHVNNRGFQS